MLDRYLSKDDITIDHFDEREIIRPNPHSYLKYDFDFRKKGEEIWRYLNSSDDINAFDYQLGVVLDYIKSGEAEYRILISQERKIVKTNVVI